MMFPANEMSLLHLALSSSGSLQNFGQSLLLTGINWDDENSCKALYKLEKGYMQIQILSRRKCWDQKAFLAISLQHAKIPVLKVLWGDWRKFYLEKYIENHGISKIVFQFGNIHLNTAITIKSHLIIQLAFENSLWAWSPWTGQKVQEGFLLINPPLSQIFLFPWCSSLPHLMGFFSLFSVQFLPSLFPQFPSSWLGFSCRFCRQIAALCLTNSWLPGSLHQIEEDGLSNYLKHASGRDWEHSQ